MPDKIQTTLADTEHQMRSFNVMGETLVDEIAANVPISDSQGVSEIVIDSSFIESNQNPEEPLPIELNETTQPLDEITHVGLVIVGIDDELNVNHQIDDEQKELDLDMGSIEAVRDAEKHET
jgi:hypothetical protein